MVKARKKRGTQPFFTPQSSLVRTELWVWLSAIATLIMLFFLFGVYFHAYHQRFFPGLRIDGVSIEGLDKAQARELLAQRAAALPETTITLRVDDIALASSSGQLGLHRSYDQALERAWSVGHSGSLFTQVTSGAWLLFWPRDYQSELGFEARKVAELVERFSLLVNTPDTRPAATLKYSGSPQSLSIFAGAPGRAVVVDQTLTALLSAPPTQLSEVVVPVASTSSPLTETEQADAQERAKTLVGKTLNLRTPELTLRLNDQEMISLLTFPEGVSESDLHHQLQEWAQRIEHAPQEPVFTYNPTTLVVSAFTPPRDGVALDFEAAAQTLRDAITQWTENRLTTSTQDVTLPTRTQPPQHSLASLNDLGIGERVGFGESEYHHSIPSRIHNVALTAKRINNTLIAPGAEFSFNKTLGDVSPETGFQPAYVIKSGQTVLGDGGGVCQVSSTLFRTLLDAGLPITRRIPHSYRVSYYELDRKPGFDATVYAGNIDLRFTNDTGHYLLLHTETDSSRLYMKVELYGTSDGRTTEILNYKTWGYEPPPAPVYIPDPTLPSGKLKQVDWSASGISASFTNRVKDKNGQVIRENTYTSHYVPWSAKYLRGI